MKVRINIALKKAVLDTQGKAIENSLVKNLGYSQIGNVRQGKFVDFEINETDENKINNIVDSVCDKLLVNKIIEDYSFEIIKN
ncbi:MAG: phosphoribosylformylglycinamidine synthase subunit PurS [Alphaproteobacteria bacterium]|nr:phosphoribosylformylglycinamidine synthase subunit PurS [Alphaproteobacteria bacterium]